MLISSSCPQPQLGLPLVLVSVVVYINGIPSESCHGLLVRDFPAVLHVEFNHPVRLRCLEIPLDSSPFKGPHSAFRPSFERLGVRTEKKLWRFMTFEFFILTQVLDSGCPICFLELTLGNYILQVAFFHLINVLSKLSLYDLNTIHILATRMLERPEGE